MPIEKNSQENNKDVQKLEIKRNLIEQLIIFNGLNNETISELVQQSKFVKFEVGQMISTKDIIPKNIFIILDGEARLIVRDRDREQTLAKLSYQTPIGLGSLLRASPCEQVSASTEVKGIAIPSALILSIYQEDNKFRKFCNENFFPCEIADLTQILIKKSQKSDIQIRKNFNLIMNNAKLITIENNNKINLDENISLFIGSSNFSDRDIGDSISMNDTFNISSPLKGRILCVPSALVKEFNATQTQSKDIENNIQNNILLNNDNLELSPNFPEKSNLNLQDYSIQKKPKIILAKGIVPEALACLQMLAINLDIPFRKDSIEKYLKDELRKTKELSIQILGSISSILGLTALGKNIPIEFANRMPTPAIIKWNDTFVLVTESNFEELTIQSPREGIVKLSLKELENIYPKNIPTLFLEKTNLTPNKIFNFEWFLPSIKKFKNSLILVLVSSFVVQLFGLANPLLIQVIIDKVITQRSLDTLQILGFALVVVTILGGFLGSLRTFLFTETTNRIDTRLGAEVIDHLLRLPLTYFDKRPVGELGSRVSELEKIREFLTGQALTTLLDAVFSIIYILVMVAYSWKLTFVALAVIPVQIFITLLGSPLLRRQIREVAQQNAKTQSHLVEVLTGVQTVKAQNIETVSRWKWQELYTTYISKTFGKIITTTTLGQTSSVLQQISQLMVLWIGATLVLNGNLTLGQLIAFRIISGYVTQPLLRLSTIWQNIQELRVSFERLADIIDTPEESNESDKTNISLPEISGKIEFDNVVFSFTKRTRRVLNGVSFKIAKGQFIGIAGESGSGKSTLMKLLARLYEPDKGRILIDNYDINKIELYSLRRQIGIVPQEPLLFSGSISENIAITNPEINSEEIINAAKISNAHDFIMELPEGYSTKVGERGSTLSGGQRQRIAIARTLISQPNLIIMDEATSALDYQTERKVCENIRESCKGTTVFFITHRLNTISNSDSIIMMHNGSIEEVGNHKDLLAKEGRYYALYRQQEFN